MKINENALAKRVVELEGGKTSVNISQVKEVLKLALEVLANDFKLSEVVALVEKHQD